MAMMMKLADKEVKTAIINSLHMFKKIEKKHKHDEERNGRYKKRPKWSIQRLKTHTT